MDAPIGSVSSTFAMTCFTNPPKGASISSVALSVSISKITSPFFTSSPTLTRQLTTVPSSIVWPSCGSLISFAIYSILVFLFNNVLCWAGYCPTDCLTAATICSTLGMLAFSSGSLMGGGTSIAARLTGRPSR